MIQIENVIPMNKNSLLAICDVYIVPWDMMLHEVKVFEKGTNRWLGMPSKSFTNQSGETKYKDLVTFKKESTNKRFRDQILSAIDTYLSSNPQMITEDVIKSNEELPF